jgi:hypothetical protein
MAIQEWDVLVRASSSASVHDPVALPVSELRTATAFRAEVDVEHARALAAYDGEYPPLLVSWPDRVVIDGAHRLYAARLRRRTHVLCELFEGSDADAFVAFVARNVTHGLPLPLAERRSAAQRILAAKPEWSDRRVARTCALSAGAVARIRRALPACDATSRHGRDGRVRPTDRNAMRRSITEAIRTDPSASLRQIAGLTGASPETVRKVRLQLGSSEEVLPRAEVDSQDAACKPPLHVCAEASTAGWRADAALQSTTDGRRFAEWFHRTQIDDAWKEQLASVPLSKVYEIADEARRRSRSWTEFARCLEQRPRAKT